MNHHTSTSGSPNLWTMQADSSNSRQLLQTDQHQDEPLWTKDGQSILYVQDHGGDERFEIYRVSSRGGMPSRLTSLGQTSAINPVLSPDGKWIAFNTKRENDSFSNVAIMDLQSNKVRALTDQSDKTRSWTVAAWSPDGRAVYAMRGSPVFGDSAVYRIDVGSGEASNLTPHSGKISFQMTDVSPDGKTLSITSNEGGYSNVALLNVESRQQTWVTHTHWDAQAGYFSTRSGFEYALNADGRRSLVFVALPSMHSTKITLPNGMNYETGNPTPFSPDGTELMAMHQDSTRPLDLWTIDLRRKNAKQITHSVDPSLSSIPLPQSQIVHYRSFDGTLISAFLWMPFNLKRDGANPAVVYAHGGPSDQTTDEYNAIALALASRGYVIIAPNVRGSTGYGLNFEEANHKDLGGGDLKDEVYAAKFLISTGYVDAKRVGIAGGSYGGFMSMMAIGKTPTVWAAAAEEYGIVNWLSFVKHSDPYLQQYIESLLGEPNKDRSLYEMSSPLDYFKNARAPLLVLQGANDIRVPKEEAIQVVNLLRHQGKTVKARFYPGEGHGFTRRGDEIDALSRIVTWFDKFLKRQD